MFDAPSSDIDPSWQRPDGTPLVHRPGVDYSPAETDSESTENEEPSKLDTLDEVLTEQSSETSEATRDVPLTATSRVGRLLQRAADRLENGADRADAASERTAEMKEKAKEKVKGLGRSALSHLKKAGLITAKAGFTVLGAGVMGARETAKGVKKGAEAVKSKVADAREMASDYAAVRRQKAERAAEEAATQEAVAHANKIRAERDQEAAFASYEDNIQRSAELDEAYEMNEAFDQKRQEINDAHAEALTIHEKRERKIAKAERAKARREARRAKWAKRREALKQYGRDVKEGFTETKDAAKDALKNTYESGKEKAVETRRKIGAAATDFAARAESAGRGAVEGWKNPGER